MVTSEEVREQFLHFFRERGHQVVPSSSLIPENDPSVLLTTAGMLQFKPYLMGDADPVASFGSRDVCSIQKCFRTTDIEEVGDETHLTFFEMLGNFSFGGYFKDRAIALSAEFLMSRESLGLNAQKVFITAFGGDHEVPRDDEAIALWQEKYKEIGIEAKIGERIFLYGRDKNWWELDPGPAGPDAEMFYDRDLPHDTRFGPTCHPNCDCGRFIEIGNDVFVQYYKTPQGKYQLLQQKAVDNGRGFDRLVMVLQGKQTPFETDLFEPLRRCLAELAPNLTDRPRRTILDHVRSSAFLIADGVYPSNLERGYILRRILRRLTLQCQQHGVQLEWLPKLLAAVSEKYSAHYPELIQLERINRVAMDEVKRFGEVLVQGLRRFDRIVGANDSAEELGEKFFILHTSHGLPREISEEVARERGYNVNNDTSRRYDDLFRQHQSDS